MYDLSFVIDEFINGLQSTLNVISSFGDYLLIPLYVAVGCFFIYSILRFISRL